MKQVWFEDDYAGAGRIKVLYDWYKYKSKEGRKYAYHVNGSKSWLIVNSQQLMSEAELVFAGEVNISTEGKRHLGAVIGSKNYKAQYYNKKISEWKEELTRLTEIAKNQPHTPYIAYKKGFKSKFTFCT